MVTDRYLKIVLTVIAIELFWIGIKDTAPGVAAQGRAAQPRPALAGAPAAPVPVIIRGIEMAGPEAGLLPVGVVGSYRRIPAEARDAVDRLTAEVTTERAIRVETDRPLDVTVQGTVRMEAARPIPVEAVPFTPARRPGE